MQMAHEEHASNPTEDGIEITDKPTATVKAPEDSERRLTATEKRRIVSVLFGRLINTHKTIMKTLVILHIIVLIAVGFHMFNLGTIESESNSCYLTWPLTHLIYMFVNYLFAWFYCYNVCEVAGKKGPQLLIVSKRFLKILLLFAFAPIPLKFVVERFCRNWTLSYEAVGFQTAHIALEVIAAYIYFSWFEKKYSGLRIFYKESLYK